LTRRQRSPKRVGARRTGNCDRQTFGGSAAPSLSQIGGNIWPLPNSRRR